MNCCDSIFLSYPHICYRYYISLDPVPDRTLSCVKRPISSEQVTAWESFYAVGPYEGILASRLELRERVLGGEARMWGEYIYGSAPLNTAWPRAAATVSGSGRPAPTRTLLRPSHASHDFDACLKHGGSRRGCWTWWRALMVWPRQGSRPPAPRAATSSDEDAARIAVSCPGTPMYYEHLHLIQRSRGTRIVPAWFAYLQLQQAHTDFPAGLFVTFGQQSSG